MIFLDETNKRVILSVRKCGFSTLVQTVGDVFKNKTGSRKYSLYDFDKYHHKDIKGNFGNHNFDVWENYDVVLIIRHPWERYVSGIRTLWKPQVVRMGTPITTTNKKELRRLLDTWFEKNFTGDYEFNDPHTANWLYNTKKLKFKSLEVVDTKNLSDWLLKNNFKGYHLHKSDKVDLTVIDEYLKTNHLDQIQHYLKNEFEVYEYWHKSEFMLK